MEEISIGKDCLIADSVSIYDHDHRFDNSNIPICKQGFLTSPVHISDNVWICSHVVICRGVKIGSGSIISAGSVVTKEIPENVIAAVFPQKFFEAEIMKIQLHDCGKSVSIIWLFCL